MTTEVTYCHMQTESEIADKALSEDRGAEVDRTRAHSAQHQAALVRFCLQIFCNTYPQARKGAEIAHR